MAIKHIRDYAPCSVPLRRITFGDAVISVHEGVVDSIKRIEARWLARGGNSWYRIRKADTGCYVCRNIAGSSKKSIHSWGVAIDINWQTNPMSSRLITDMPREFVQLFIDEGWGWGGNWSGKKDAMHMSKAPNEGGDDILSVPATYIGSTPPTTSPSPSPQPPEEEDMYVTQVKSGDGGAIIPVPQGARTLYVALDSPSNTIFRIVAMGNGYILREDDPWTARSWDVSEYGIPPQTEFLRVAMKGEQVGLAGVWVA